MRSLLTRGPNVWLPDALGGKNEMDVPRTVLDHSVQCHLGVPQQTEREAPTGEHHPLRIDVDFMLLSLANDRIVRMAVLGVPVRVFLADPIDHARPTLLRLSHKTVNS